MKHMNKMRKVEANLLNKIKSDGCIHLTLIDPEKTPPSDAAQIAKLLEQLGTTAILVGGSTIFSSLLIEKVIKAIKSVVNIPVILFPNNVSGISRYADAIWFMSLLNSNNPLYITGFQALAAPMIKQYGIETIPLGYIIIGEGSTVAYVGQAHAIPRDADKIATGYALAAEFLGMHFVYLEGGSGVKQPISPKMVSMVKQNVSIPVIVGGGIREKESAERIAKAGADCIVTGTIIEKNTSGDKIGEIIETIRTVKKQ